MNFRFDTLDGAISFGFCVRDAMSIDDASYDPTLANHLKYIQFATLN